MLAQNQKDLSVSLLKAFCAQQQVAAGIDQLSQQFNRILSGYQFNWVMTRGSWHRLGGVVDVNGDVIHRNIETWLDEQDCDDIDAFLAAYSDKNYCVTQVSGKTHYFNAIVGPNPQDFVQLEIEELQEVVERPLVDLDGDTDAAPETLADVINPVTFKRLPATPIGAPRYAFRRITHIGEWLKASEIKNHPFISLRRFFSDWSASSAGEEFHFSEFWILSLREYLDRDGEISLSAKPVPVIDFALPALPEADENLRGSKLASAIHGYDRKLGFGFAWYFMMLSCASRNYTLAEAVFREQMGAYDYLPARDLHILRHWEKEPYAV